MAMQTSSEKDRPEPDTIGQQSTIDEAETVAAARVNPGGILEQDALQHESKLDALSTNDDDLRPPPYGEIYGEISNENDGMGTSASVTNDGRVNIRINQFNRRLSQIFTPALQEHIQSVQDSNPPPPPYVPPSLGGEEGVSPPPRLNIVIQVVGSRGDVQPFVALGKVLRNTYGHRVRLATHPTFKSFVQENGLEFFSIGGDPTRLMAFMVKNPGLRPGMRSIVSGDIGQRRKDVAEYIQGCWRSCYEAGDGTDDEASESFENDNDLQPPPKHFVADCIIANPPSFAHIHCAEKLGIPLHIMFTMPYSPTQAFPHPLANIQSSNADPQLSNYVSYAMIELLSWQGIGDIINRFRGKCLGLDPVSTIWAPGMLQRLKIPHTYCWSPALIPKPRDWGSHISISGFYFLNLASNYTPAQDLQTFLDEGPPPVYIGFGSIVLENPDAMTELIFEAVSKTGQRLVLSKGWGGIGVDDLNVPNVFMLGNVPHDWLFKHVSCVVHHGGAGTTAAGISAGRPTLVVPFFGDQPFWGAMISRAGAGPDPIPHKQLTADKLTDAINFCLKPETLRRAQDLADQIATERGSDKGAQSFHQFLDPNRLRCTLAPSRPAAWCAMRGKVRLSAFAAYTLENANLLDFKDLRPFRPQEHYTDEGPWDPISGGFTAFVRAVGGMSMGLADVPSETWRAMRTPAERSRQQSQASLKTVSSKGKASTPQVGESSKSSILPRQNETSLIADESPANARSVSGRSTPTSNIGSSAVINPTQDQVAAKQNVPKQSQSTIRNGSSSSKDADMLRPTGVHMSRGAGRFVKALVQGPVDISVNLTRGVHNLPKLWGDDTVRPQERVGDFKSGMKAVGREFGYGWYDGITGLVTQPWNGAKKEGAGGFVKGVGKGLGGFLAKPGSAVLGILSHSLQGVNKEAQKLFGNDVQGYIAASRAAQGYDEWLQRSDAEKEDVIVRWKLIQKYLKKKVKPDETMQDLLEAQQRMNMECTQARQNYERAAQSSAEINGTAQMLFRNDSEREAEELTNVERSTQERELQSQSQRHDAREAQEDVDSLRRAITFSEIEAERQASEASEYEKQLQQVIAQSLREQTLQGNDSGWESYLDVNDEDERSKDARGESDEMTGRAGSQSALAPRSNDPGHLAGTTQREFEAQQQERHTEKTAQEKTEEEIVMEYVKKQSLLEKQHREKGKGRATEFDDKDNGAI